jgi:hypothetical protein
MMGEYERLTQRPQKTLRWWRKSIRAGERLDARLELARTHYEVGRHLMDSGFPYATLDGIGAATYLKRSREAFETMGLTGDLDKLSRLDVY